MTEGTIELLTRLLQEAPGANNTYLQKSRDFWDGDWTPEELEALARQFHDYYVAEVAQVRGAWGEPAFAGGHEDPGFPDWCPGLEVSYWDRGDRIAYLWWEHQDQELPFFLVAGAMTKEELAE